MKSFICLRVITSTSMNENAGPVGGGSRGSGTHLICVTLQDGWSYKDSNVDAFRSNFESRERKQKATHWYVVFGGDTKRGDKNGCRGGSQSESRGKKS
jgi:hypothetical protein